MLGTVRRCFARSAPVARIFIAELIRKRDSTIPPQLPLARHAGATGGLDALFERQGYEW